MMRNRGRQFGDALRTQYRYENDEEAASEEHRMTPKQKRTAENLKRQVLEKTTKQRGVEVE